MAHDIFTQAHMALSGVGVPGEDIPFLPERILKYADRLCLRPEGEPDTADLVGKINEVCDAVGVPEADPFFRVQWLADRYCAERTANDHLLSDLAAERAQLAAATKPERQNVDRAALIRVIKMCAEELT